MQDEKAVNTKSNLKTFTLDLLFYTPQGQLFLMYGRQEQNTQNGGIPIKWVQSWHDARLPDRQALTGLALSLLCMALMRPDNDLSLSPLTPPPSHYTTPAGQLSQDLNNMEAMS